MYGVRLLALLLLLVVLNSFVNGGDGGLSPVAVAAERAEKTPGARFSMRIVYSAPSLGRAVTATGGGVYNAETERSRIRLDLKNPLTGEGIHIFSVSDSRFTYTSGGTVEDVLPPGKQWVRKPAGVQDSDDPIDIQDSLQMLCSSGDVEMIGHERIGGASTRRYRGEVTLAEFVDYLREVGKDEVADAYEGIEDEAVTGISSEGWVDRKNLLRRMRMVMPVPGDPGEPAMTIDMQMDFFDYGAHPRIRMPRPADVVDASDLAPEVDSVPS